MILKGRNSIPICISIPTLKDKVCLKATLKTLKEYFPECKNTLLSQECIKEIKSKIDSKKYDYFITLNISNFYGDIKHYKLMMMLRDRIKDETFLDLIKQAIIPPIYPDKSKSISGVPQGLSSSNILAQIYMTKFDGKFKN
ncbi:reverse transcriptase domain-containing protein [Carnobacterium gallinarum]|uniref:reverse transcriptase domain-containing protein n=1 Tax=Carnobacterium gallinarum TaxID=2749 RepID=UPI00068FD59D|nr:reverse transcriptase domain-containing protein [Carnobacterium gallinarum]